MKLSKHQLAAPFLPRIQTTLVLVGIGLCCVSCDANHDNVADGHCRAFASLTTSRSGYQEATEFTDANVLATSGVDSTESSTDIVRYESVASFITEARALGVITAESKLFRNGGGDSSVTEYAYGPAGELVSTTSTFVDGGGIDSELVTVWESYDSQGRPLTGVGVLRSREPTNGVCAAMQFSVEYDDVTRIVTRREGMGVQEGGDGVGDPCGSEFVKVTTYDSFLNIVQEARWFGTTEPEGKPSRSRSYTIDEMTTICE